jgi:hypothetical protein
VWFAATALAGVATLGVTAPAVTASATARAAAPIGYAGPARAVTHLPSKVGAPQQFNSRNWAGYLTYASTQSTDFNVVKATWVEPTVRCEAKNAWTVFWVGLDGWWDGTVEQGGSSAYCPTKGGAAQHSLWWEMYPTNAIQTVLAISAGDTVTASVTYAPGTSVFTIKVRDLTSKKGFTQHEMCASNVTCARSSAEVITEDVGMFGANAYFPLADYGTMGYTGIGVTDTAGRKGTISNRHWLDAAVTESSAGVTYATVSPLAANGSAFMATWHHK